ncbi:MAG: cofactor-independent phosphoglycerate mutase [Nanoarchaeota archaeon]|nr:cofactor-independent phosphoglycerate mutase [Nanoarchaeota archaeon]MBU1004892.1 cofactor-independent phosphoglycerate mutase [Nanoarchaeota archaeon]MBU1945397.1 cofactor-independent phosphoglycerate mutase [Nanoarchaeota archaeon]
MKHIIFLIDGAADYACGELDGKTPLQAANKPNIDLIAKKGKCGMLETVPKDMQPDSAVANMSLLGYDLKRCYQGRGVLEAANMGVELESGDVALRCNLITVEDNKIKDYSSGHISNEEAEQLIRAVDRGLGNKEIKFYPGVSYRHLIVLKGNKFSSDIECYPPHDFIGSPIAKVLVKARGAGSELTAGVLNKLMFDSKNILEKHPVNIERKKNGKNIANSVWFWSPGRKPEMETFQEIYGIKGAVISAVDLINGLGRYAGFDVIKVNGATGLWDTNYEGKADACVEALKNHDLVYVHVEAPDEAGHSGDAKLKVKTIEDFDKRLLGRVLDKVKGKITISILPDHLTPIKLKTHVYGAVPFVIYRSGKKGDKVEKYDEENCKKGYYGLLKGNEFIKEFLDKKR